MDSTLWNRCASGNVFIFRYGKPNINAFYLPLPSSPCKPCNFNFCNPCPPGPPRFPLNLQNTKHRYGIHLQLVTLNLPWQILAILAVKMELLLRIRQFLLKRITFSTIFTVATVQKTDKPGRWKDELQDQPDSWQLTVSVPACSCPCYFSTISCTMSSALCKCHFHIIVLCWFKW